MSEKRKSRRPGSGRKQAFLILCTAVTVAMGWFLNRSGPLAGWADRLLGRSPKEQVMQPAADPPATPPENVPADQSIPQPEPPRTDPLEQRYRELVETFLDDRHRPETGSSTTLHLVDGGTVTGSLQDIKPGRIVLKLDYGVMTYPIHRVHPKDLDRLFPERKAARKAMAALQRELKHARKDTAAPAPRAPATEKTREPTPQHNRELRYDPRRAATPDVLRPPLKAFAAWLEMQHRRVGGKIADGLFAKSHGQAVVLYVRLNRGFFEQDYDTRFATAEATQRIWAIRCAAAGVVNRLTDAHVVLLAPDGSITGGSTPEDAAAVWIRHDRGTH